MLLGIFVESTLIIDLPMWFGRDLDAFVAHDILSNLNHRIRAEA